MAVFRHGLPDADLIQYGWLFTQTSHPIAFFTMESVLQVLEILCSAVLYFITSAFPRRYGEGDCWKGQEPKTYFPCLSCASQVYAFEQVKAFPEGAVVMQSSHRVLLEVFLSLSPARNNLTRKNAAAVTQSHLYIHFVTVSYIYC